MISSVSEGTCKIETVLQMKRVFIVLDDIDDKDELSTLLGIKVLHTQSKIIITTRLLDIDGWFRSISWRCRVHKVELLNDHESLELLNWYAFGSKIPVEGFEEPAVEVAQYCEGNPLALKVLGSSLFVSDEDSYTTYSMIEIWRSRLNSLNSLKGDLDSKIQGVLQTSFDSLPLASHRELFLHIACFFVGEFMYDVVRILEDDWYAKSGFRTLINRCLLTISARKKLSMHQLLQDMGRKMVHDESKDPAKRSRVWSSDEAYHILRIGDGSKKIEGLSLDIGKLKKGTRQPRALKTDALVKMKNLKFLRLIGVELVGPYRNFPELRWLYWLGCHLKIIPSGLLMSSLVAIDMSCGNLEKFEPPTDLYSLKVLNLRCSRKLVSICGFTKLPKLETLLLWYCSSLTHICTTIGDLKNLHTLVLSWCTKLWKSSSNKKYKNQLERLKYFCIGGGLQEQPLFSLPQSLKLLCLDFCDLEFKNDPHVVFHGQSFFSMNLRANLFEYLPDSIDLKTLQVLNLTSCRNLKSLPCLPSTLQDLCINWCTSLERITFQSARFSLKRFGYEGCIKLSEIQGLFKLVSIAKIDEADLGDMKWIKAYQHDKADLIGDDITKGRSWHIQMLYEYGIRSTFLRGIKDQSMTTYEYMSSSAFLSFRLPFHLKENEVQGLHVSCIYRSSGEDKDTWILFVSISNRTKGVTWVYNPVVYCKPKVDEDVMWLSYWPIGNNILDAGDEVFVDIIGEDGLTVSSCGASPVYLKDGEVEKEENCENRRMKVEEVIGGDLSEFEVTMGGYYLCRRDFYKSRTPDWLKWLFGDDIHYTDSQGWRKSRQPMQGLYPNMKGLNDLFHKKIELGVSFNTESEINKMEETVYSLAGVESVFTDKELGRLIVTGQVDAQAVVTCVRKFEKMVVILRVDY